MGRPWGSDVVLRRDGGNWDLGYPRTVQRPDGKLVTVYYFNEDASKERLHRSDHLAAVAGCRTRRRSDSANP